MIHADTLLQYSIIEFLLHDSIMHYLKQCRKIQLVVDDEEPSLKTSNFPLSFHLVKQPIPFVHFLIHYLQWQR